jgi:hypothetical protein
VKPLHTQEDNINKLCFLTLWPAKCQVTDEATNLKNNNGTTGHLIRAMQSQIHREQCGMVIKQGEPTPPKKGRLGEKVATVPFFPP